MRLCAVMLHERRMQGGRNKKAFLLVIAVFVWKICCVYAQFTACNSTEAYHCNDGMECINIKNFCDGNTDCSDGSDELTATAVNDTAPIENGMTCKPRYGANRCWIPKNYTDKYKCKTDMDCDSPGLVYHCWDGKQCIHMDNFCDGIIDCADGSDEFTANETSLENGTVCDFKYSNIEKECWLQQRYIGDLEVDCKDGKDECNMSSTFICQNGHCDLKVHFCDNQDNHCEDKSDETQYNRATKIGFQCPVSVTHFTRSCVLPDQYVCDGDSDCDYGIDECFCTFNRIEKKGIYNRDVYSNDKCFRCFDGSLIIPNIHVCDGVVHCEDLSDECFCPNLTKRPAVCNLVCKASNSSCNCTGQVVCGQKNCLPSTAICDVKPDCPNREDEKFCAVSNETFPCNDNLKRLRIYQVCDGIFDCDDKSDETECEQIRDFRCNNFHKKFPDLPEWKSVLKYFIENDENVSFDRPYYTKKCDDVPMCEDLEDECYNHTCSGQLPGYCKFVDGKHGFVCNNSQSAIIGVEICDGVPTCNRTDPHKSIDELFCPNRLYCKDNGESRLPIHIPVEWKCDGHSQCYDESDEMGCPNTTHFYCNDGGPKLYVDVSKKCDGRQDCMDGGDECIECTKTTFSDDKKLIKSVALRALLWIVGLFSVIGNTAVIIHQLKQLLLPQGKPTVVSISNRILVLNLSASDLLVGVYLVAIGIKDASVNRYCLYDQEWRSSSTCSALGVIALIGTETSVFILMIMTAYRLYLVVKPFQNQNQFFIIPAVAFSWIFSILLATIPLAFSAKDYFVSCVWYGSNPFFGRICKKDLQTFTSDLVTYEGKGKVFSPLVENGYTWDSMFAAVKKLNASYVPERYFGFYSAHGVCLPRLFPDPNQDESWKYSFFLILLNFFAFLFILFSYIVIYRTSMKRNDMKGSRKGDRSVAMQRKVTRIVLTDFFCWMPICIMSFVRISGVEINDIAYAFTAIILVPINSAMNPFLYTDIIDILWKKCSKRTGTATSTSGTRTERINVTNIDESCGSVTNSTKLTCHVETTT